MRIMFHSILKAYWYENLKYYATINSENRWIRLTLVHGLAKRDVDIIDNHVWDMNVCFYMINFIFYFVIKIAKHYVDILEQFLLG